MVSRTDRDDRWFVYVSSIPQFDDCLTEEVQPVKTLKLALPGRSVAGAAVPKSPELTSFQDLGADLPVGPLVRESQHARSLTS